MEKERKRDRKPQVRLSWRNTLLIALVWGGSVLGAPSAHAQELLIAAASDLNFAFKEILQRYEETTGHTVKLSLGSSGNFFSQIQHGAPYDLYFSADIRFPQKLEEAGFAVPGTLYQYAVGRIVVWVRNDSSLSLDQLGMAALEDPTVRTIAVANPKHAPYGMAAVAAMEHFRLYDRVKDKLVLGENISQAAQFVQSGAADIGIVALSLALAPTMRQSGRYWAIPLEAYPPLVQGAVQVKAGKNPQAAKTFLQFLQGAKAQEIMRGYGFVLPQAVGSQ